MTPKLLKKPLFIICTLVLVSILLRLHVFKSPIGGSHAWLSAHVVLTSLIWDSEGIGTYNYSPIYTFFDEADKNMRSLASGISDNQGNYYYVSYPPFSFILAYFFFKLFYLSPSFEALQILNIFIQGSTAFVIYLIISTLYRKKTNTLFATGVVGSAFYIFSAQSMWCHIYMYFADTLIQVLWTLCIFLSFLVFRRNGAKNWIILFFLGFTNFLSVYTEWLGLFFAVVLIAYSLYKGIRNKIFFRVTLIVLLTTFLAFLLTLWQYSFIDGLDNLLKASAAKYMDRSGMSQYSFYYMKIDSLRLLNHYWRLHKANIIIILFFVITSLTLFKHFKSSNFKDHLYLIVITTCPIIMHHAAFLEFSSMHDFSTLKSLVLICFVISFLFNLITTSSPNPDTHLFLKRICLSVITLILLLNISLYYSKINFQPHTTFSIASVQIDITSSSNEALYSSTRSDRENGIMVYMGRERAFSPQIQLLTQRNIFATSGREEAITHMKTFEYEQGIHYIFDQYGRLTGIEKIVNRTTDN